MMLRRKQDRDIVNLEIQKNILEAMEANHTENNHPLLKHVREKAMKNVRTKIAELEKAND